MMSTIIISLNNTSDESLITRLLRRLGIPFQIRADGVTQEQRAVNQLRAGLRDALLEAEAIQKGQQEGTTWQAFLAELDQESLEMEGTNG
jgi:hypothetical protein